MKVAAQRESSFELIRILAQWMIVLYHIMIYIATISDIPLYTAIWLPLHIGVPLFVLISGYWGIRVSCKGLFRLLGQMFVYTIPLLMIYNYLHLEGSLKVFYLFLILHIGSCGLICVYICSLLL